MSHHFDTDEAKQDPRLNICDMYLFPAGADRTVMVMTVNADAGLSSPDVFHPEGIYSFRFDTNGDLRDDVVFKVRFSEPFHAHGEEHRHAQHFDVIKAAGGEMELIGTTVLSGGLGETVVGNDIKAFAGMVPELWAADALAFQIALVGVITEDKFHAEAFENHQNTFEKRNVMAIVLEVPNDLIGVGEVHMWGTISLFGHAAEMQVYRFGLPLITHLFLANPTTPDLMDQYNLSNPLDDDRLIRPAIEIIAKRMITAAGNQADPSAAAAAVAARLNPEMMPYVLGTPAEYTLERFNGRTLGEDVYDVMWSLATGRPIKDGVEPDVTRITSEFPYYGKVYSAEEQDGFTPIIDAIGYNPDAKIKS